MANSEVRAARARSFDSDPELYDRARPTYPAEMFDGLWKMAELSAHPQVVEVGCGTGQASVDLIRRGCELTCVEMGANMAAVARRNLAHLPGFSIEVSKFEDWDPGARRYDLVFSAASWHWIDRETRYAKAASVLKQDGSLAVLFSKHAFPEDYDPLFDEIQRVYEAEVGSNLIWPPGLPETISDEREEMEASGFFKKVSVGRYLWHLDMSADEYIALLGTYSDNRIREEEERQRLFAKLHEVVAPAGTIRKHYLSVLRVGRK